MKIDLSYLSLLQDVILPITLSGDICQVDGGSVIGLSQEDSPDLGSYSVLCPDPSPPIAFLCSMLTTLGKSQAYHAFRSHTPHTAQPTAYLLAFLALHAQCVLLCSFSACTFLWPFHHAFVRSFSTQWPSPASIQGLPSLQPL